MALRNPYYDPDQSHHTPQGFRNPPEAQVPVRAPGGVRRWRRERREAGLPKPPAGGYEAFRAQWWRPADFTAPGDAAWWLGHACVLLRVGGLTVLTDPVLSARASPVAFAGPRRHTPPPATVATLPQVDVVLISHSHYDHLDRATVRALARRFPQATFLAPLGLADWLRKRGVRVAHELDWWQSREIGGATFHCVPAQHWSARTLRDRNRTLWGGWVMQRGEFRFYFAGDTGYGAWLQAIGERLGPFDLAALPIGAYAPRWFMRAHHTDPAQAVRLHCELRARRSLAIHWGVFQLADDALDEPPALLAQARAEAGVAEAAFPAVPVGTRLSLG